MLLYLQISIYSIIPWLQKIRTPQVASHSSVSWAAWPGMDLLICHIFFGEQESGMLVWSHLPKKIWRNAAPKKNLRSHGDIYFRPSRFWRFYVSLLFLALGVGDEGEKSKKQEVQVEGKGTWDDFETLYIYKNKYTSEVYGSICAYIYI